MNIGGGAAALRLSDFMLKVWLNHNKGGRLSLHRLKKVKVKVWFGGATTKEDAYHCTDSRFVSTKLEQEKG